MADENGLDEGSDPIDEEDRVEGTRRVRPLFRFGRKKEPKGDRDDEHGEPEPEEDAHDRVRPVRVVKFVPESEEEGPIAEVDSGDLEAAFAGDEGEPVEVVKATFAVEDEAPFDVEEEAPFDVEEEAPFDVEEEAPFAIEDEAPFDVEDEAPFAVEEEARFAVEEEAPFAIEEGESPFVMEEGEQIFVEAEAVEEAPFAEMGAVPEVPFAEIEEVEREEPVHDAASPEEEAETAEEFEFRAEETPEGFQAEGHAGVDAPTIARDEAKPHYHKYLKPDEELLQQKQAKGRPTGFDRDLDADAGEIDFGIDLIDPSERRKRKAPKGAKEAKLKKSVTGGHDFDGEVGTRELGVDIGVDYQKRRKRRL